MDNYEELLDYSEQWTAQEFFYDISPSYIQDDELRIRFNTAKKAFKELHELLIGKVNGS